MLNKFYIKIKICAIILLVANSVFLNAQAVGEVFGKVSDNNMNPLPGVNITLINNVNIGSITDANGDYKITVPVNDKINLVFSSIGYISDTVQVKVGAGSKLRLNKQLLGSTIELPDIVVKGDKETHRTQGINILNAKDVSKLPSATNSVESLIKTLPGVSSNSDLSSQYSVRGGSFDENLVYVNDIEIYRPFLVRSGTQEGLSFLNSSLVSSISFSAGGFEAKYGDKMSSVLDIRYKNPIKFEASADVSLLGANFHIEDISNNKKFSYLIGSRFKSNAFLLKQMNIEANYLPLFFDIQALFNYKINSKLGVSFLGYYSDNIFKMIPKSEKVDYGTSDTPLRLYMYYEGEEVDKYKSKLGGLTFTYNPNSKLVIKWIASAYISDETESYDILGEYLLALVNDRPDFNDSIEVVETLGVGAYRSHARNVLNVLVSNLENRYYYNHENSTSQWSVKFQNEQISDRVHEWQLIDSAGYSMPNPTTIPGLSGNLTSLVLSSFFDTKNNLNSNRISAFYQNSRELILPFGIANLNLGVRGQYWSFNKEFFVSPRATVSLKPDWKSDIIFRFSAGFYNQSPFFKELRNFEGAINKNVKAQKTIHFVLGSNLNFKAFDRPFMFTTDFYYKHLANLIPYEVENVRIKYHPNLSSKGFAYGADMKIFGEFVSGIDSWFSVSLLNTKEDVIGDTYTKYFNSEGEQVNPKYTNANEIVDSLVVYPGYIRRPNDQRLTVSIFFQDYLPMDPSSKFYLGFFYGTGIPTGAPGAPLYTRTFKIPSYIRVDMGLSKQIIGDESYRPKSGFFSKFQEIWIALDVLNLLQNKNIISYSWVKDTKGIQYGVPNYLTPRQINFKLGVRF